MPSALISTPGLSGAQLLLGAVLKKRSFRFDHQHGHGVMGQAALEAVPEQDTKENEAVRRSVEDLGEPIYDDGIWMASCLAVNSMSKFASQLHGKKLWALPGPPGARASCLTQVLLVPARLPALL